MKTLCLIKHRWNAYRIVSHGIGMVTHHQCLRYATERTNVITNKGNWF